MDFRGGYGGGGEEQEVAESRFDAEATGEAVIGKTEAAGRLLDDADPFTHELYEQQTKLSCYRDSFDDVVKQQAACFEYAPFSSIICSFAMHLCPQRQLYSLAFELLQHTKSLVIITPH